MDTKSRSVKPALAFLAFVLGVTLLVYSAAAAVIVTVASRGSFYIRIAQLPCLMPLPEFGSLVIRQDSANYATFTLVDDAVMSLLHVGDGRIVRSRVELSGVPLSRVMIRFADNRLMVIVAEDVRPVGAGLSHDDDCADDGRVLAEFDARFLSAEWAGGFVGCMAGLSD